MKNLIVLSFLVITFCSCGHTSAKVRFMDDNYYDAIVKNGGLAKKQKGDFIILKKKGENGDWELCKDGYYSKDTSYWFNGTMVRIATARILSFDNE